MVKYIRNRQELEHQIITMHNDGWSIRSLARHFEMGRNAVRRILRSNQSHRNNGHDILNSETKQVPRKSKLDEFTPKMKKLLEEFPKITGERMFEELRCAGYDGGRTILGERLKKLRPRPKHEPIVRFETEPGEQGQMDWSPYNINFTKGGKTTVLCFSYILGFSRRQYIDFTTNRKFHTLIRRHRDAFNYFKGVPEKCLYDGEKTVMLRWEAGRPVFNPRFIAFITHYNCKPIGVRRAQTKGKVEAPFQYVENNLLNARNFHDLEDLRAHGRWWLKERSDLHIHDTTGRAPLELFMQEEQNQLQPLPLHPYDCCEVAYRVCYSDGFVELETNYYSVPYDYVAEILCVKAAEQEVFIYSPELDLITRHERLPDGAGKRQENPDHRTAKKMRYGLEPVKQSFLRLGDAAESFIVGLKEKHPRNCGFHARTILGLKEHYHCDDINKALSHALLYYAFDCQAVERIVQARFSPRTLESARNEQARQRLAENMPPIKQRPLEEYSLLMENLEENSDDSEKQ